MSGLLNQCEILFGNKNLYKVFGVKKDASNDDRELFGIILFGNKIRYILIFVLLSTTICSS